MAINDYLLQEDSYKLALEDLSGFLLLETSVAAALPESPWSLAYKESPHRECAPAIGYIARLESSIRRL